jgi:hypothetical protein
MGESSAVVWDGKSKISTMLCPSAKTLPTFSTKEATVHLSDAPAPSGFLLFGAIKQSHDHAARPAPQDLNRITPFVHQSVTPASKAFPQLVDVEETEDAIRLHRPKNAGLLAS